MNGILYIVATPIGNLQDITLRALDVLKSVDVILCEDTRVTGKLLAHFQISKSMMSYHHHSEPAKVREIIELLEAGKNLALVCDAGTPGISDPGNLLVAEVISHKSEVIIVPIPGASAVLSALSISGFPTDKYVFMGFPPHKKKRQKYFQEVAAAEHTVVFYESNHRIMKCLDELKEVLSPDQQLCVCREITKKFETIYRGNIDEILAQNVSEKGEFVLVIKTRDH